MDYMGSEDKRYHEYSIGHGGLVLAVQPKQVYPTISQWLSERA